jgi:GH25 family lysozyme M1 (1,4-beta-N-acetylmuramidase)
MAIADLSKWQGDIDFGKLKNQVDFVILRVQAGYTSIDAKYKEYVAGCKANGIQFGTYAYFKGISIPDSLAEAKSALELMDPESKFFALDIEENSNSDLVGTGQAFIDYFKNKGVQKVGLYSGESFFNAHNLSAIKVDFTWIAKYGSNDGLQHTKPSVPCDLWQYTSVGHLDGITGNVDLNVLTGSKPLEWFIGNSQNNGAIPPYIGISVAQRVRATRVTDIRRGASHDSPFFRNTVTGEEFNVYKRLGDWHCIGSDINGEYWVDGAGGGNLYWIDNPALQQQPAAPVYYVIKSGDILSKIAKNNGTTIAQLQSWNGIKNPNKIYPGQKIRVR